MRTRIFNDEVVYADEPVVRISRDDMQSICDMSEHNTRRRMRLCAHRGVDDHLHEMFIVHYAGTYVRPHKHLGAIESFHIIEGTVDVVLFDETGNLTNVIPMGDYASGRCFYYRIADEQYHSLLIRSGVLIFHETTNGPFRRDETIFAAWSPPENDDQAVQSFMTRMSVLAEAHLGRSQVGHRRSA